MSSNMNVNPVARMASNLAVIAIATFFGTYFIYPVGTQHKTSMQLRPLSAPVNGFVSINLLVYDDFGKPFVGATDIVLRLFAAPIGQVAIYTETWSLPNTVEFIGGRANVQMGSVSPLPIDLFSSVNTVWLETTVNNRVLLPRVQLVASPSAFEVRDGSVTQNGIVESAILGHHIADQSITRDHLESAIAIPRLIGHKYCDPCISTVVSVTQPSTVVLGAHGQDTFRLPFTGPDRTKLVSINAEFQLSESQSIVKCQLRIVSMAGDLLQRNHEFVAIATNDSNTRYRCTNRRTYTSEDLFFLSEPSYIELAISAGYCSPCQVTFIGWRELTVVEY